MSNRTAPKGSSPQTGFIPDARAYQSIPQDKKMPPQHLTDLVSAGYLHAIPKDPFTNSTFTWVEVPEDATDSIDRTHPGIFRRPQRFY
jgi:hypothetical protein